jgi:phosphatidate cytidylyltransferase
MSDEFKMFDDEDEEVVEEPTMTIPAVGGVRITGAKPADEELFDDWALEDEVPEPPAVDLPAWTEEPTGQVPAVLARDDSSSSDDPLENVPAPTWREDAGDWSDDSEAFETLITTPSEGPVGALDTDHDIESSQPWEFEDHEIPSTPTAQDEPLFVAEAMASETHNPWDLDDLPLIPPAAAAPAEPRHRATRSRRSRRDEERFDDELAEDQALLAEREPRRRPPRDDRGGRGPRPPREPERQGATGRDLPVAIITGVIIAVLVMVTFDIGTLLALVLVIAVVVLAAAEVFAAFRRSGEHPATLLGLVATLALLIASYNKGIQAIGLVTVLLFIFCVIWYMVGVEKTDALRGISSTMFVYIWIGIFGSYAALLLNPNLFPNRHGLAFLLGAILVSVAYDIAALFIGSAVGKRPMAPAVSPNKTWEGLLGGTVAAILMAVIVVHLIHPWTLSSAFALGIVVSIVAPLGDLSESLVKRTLGLKDMGRILPGHGGLLDRVDGLLFVLPATFYLVQAFHLS